MKHALLLVFCLLASYGSRAQTLLQSQSFETGETANYTASTVASGNTNIYFYRANLPVPGFLSTSTVTNIRDASGNSGGTYFWASENVRRDPSNASPVRANPPANLTLNALSVAGKSNFSVKVALANAAANNTSGTGWETDDFVRIQYRFDGGTWTNATGGQFVGSYDMNTNPVFGPLRQDTDGDGVADGVALTQALTDFSFAIPGSGTTLEVRMQIDQDGASEEFAFDAIRVYGSAAASAAPVLANNESTTINYAEGQGAVQITNTLTITDDGTQLSGATIAISNNYQSSEDRLLFNNQNGISTTGFNTANGTLTLTGTASLANYQTALRSIQYQDIDAADASGLTRIVSFNVTDATSVGSNMVARTIAVTPSLDAPFVGLPYTEDFTATNGEGTLYGSNTYAAANGSAWLRTAINPYNPENNTGTTFSNISNSYYWFGSVTNNLSNPSATKLGILTTRQITTTGYTDLKFSLLLGATNTGGMAAGNARNSLWTTSEYIKLYYRIAGSNTWTAFGSFRGTSTSSTGIDPGVLRQDADPTATSGVPTGAALSPSLANFDFALPSSLNGQTLDFQLVLNSDQGLNDLAFDNIRVTGTPIVAPSVTTTIPTGVATTSAVLGGNVTADGGASVTARGVVYSPTTPTPTIGGSGVTQNDNGAGTGNFSETSTGLSPGTRYYVAAYATNAAGISYGSVLPFTTPPNAPVMTAPANGSLTNTATPPYSGTALTGSTVTVYVDGASIGTTTAPGGTFSLTQPTALSQGSHTVYATASVNGSVASANSNTNTFTIDIAAPTVALSSATVAGGGTTSTSPVSFTATFNEPVTGFASSGITVTGGTVTSGPTAGSGNTYAFQVTPSGAGTVTVQVAANAAQDRANNNSRASALYSLTFVPPTIAVAPASLPNGQQGTAYSQALSATGGTAPYNYALTAGALPSGLRLTNGTIAGTPTANGTFTFTVTATDNSAAPGPYSSSRSYSLVINPQPVTAAPVVTTPAVGALVNTTTPTYQGTAPANSTVSVYVDDTPIGTTTAGGTGSWSLTQPTALIQGTHTVRATAQTSGQTVSGNSPTNTFTVDTVAPTVVITSSAGASGSTTGTTPIPFSATFSEPVTGFVAADLTLSGGTVTNFAGSGTSYTIEITPTADGLITVAVPANVAQDGANNGNTASSVFSITYSRPVTATPLVVAPANGSLITTTKPTYTGTATASASLTLVVDNNTAAALTTGVDASGNWMITPLTDLAPGAHSVQARAQLTGQTASAYSPVNSFTVVVPATVATATPVGVNSNSATLGGSVTDAGAGIVRERGVVYVAGSGTPTTSDTKVIIGTGTGSFAQAVTSLLPATTYSVRAYAINQAGTSYGPTQPFMTVVGLNATATATNVTCNGGANGSAQVTPSGGVAPFTYAWSPGNPAGQGTAQVTGLTAGSYSVLITDASGATLTRSVTVSQPGPVTVNIAPANTAVCEGSVVLTASTDAVNPSFAWTGTQPTTGAQVSVTSSGTYAVTVTSGSGCTATASSVVTINGPVAAPVTTPIAVCQYAPPVSLASGVAASGGGTLRWYLDATGGSGSATAPVPPTNVAGQTIYYVSELSSAGCESPRAALPFRVNALPVATLSSDGPLSCAKPTGTLTAGGVSGVPGSSYRFSMGANQAGTTNLATVSMSGVYNVTATDGNGCSATAQTTVGSDQSNPQASLSNDGPLTCTKPTVTLTAGGTGTYRFSAGATQVGSGNTATTNTEGVYSVTVTATNGCQATAQTTVELNTTVAAPTLTASALSTENAPISVTASGCSGTLTWTATGGSGTATGAVYTITQPGNYTLTATCTVGTCTSPAAPSLALQIRPGGFAITGVELVRCQLVDAGRGQYEISFTPQYSGLSGSPVSFVVTNELAATTAPGPYTLRLYADNATIALAATQATAQASYRYNWLAACSGTQPTPNRPPVAQPIPDQVLVVGQPYQLDLTGYFADPDGQALTFTATGLPAGLQLSGTRITGSPTQAGSSTVQLTALDPGGLSATGSVLLRIDAAPITPTPGVFSIAGVTGVRCETLSVGERQLSFSPVYTGLTGESVRFGITNELAMTTAPGPYTLRLYTDNAAITLTATQGSTQATYRYNWLAACASSPTTPPPANRPPTVGTGLADQTAQVGQGFTLFIPAGTFTDPDNDPLQLSVSGLPAGLSFSAAQNAITGTPAQAGSSTILMTATDPGGLSVSTRFVLTVQPATTPTPTPGMFSIAGVTGVRCETLSVGERRLSFSPVYSGLTGEPVRFGITNELVTTTAPGPYSLKLYTDNPVISLQAIQGSTPSSYRFEWLAACASSPNGRQAVAEAGSRLSVVVLGNPVVGESAEIAIRGVEGQAVEVSLTDVAGNRLHQQRLGSVGPDERVVIPLPTRQAITLLRVSTASQHQTVKLIRP